MSDYETKFDVLGYHSKRGELIAANDVKVAIQAIVQDMQNSENKLKADAVRKAAEDIGGCEAEYKEYADKLERGDK